MPCKCGITRAMKPYNTIHYVSEHIMCYVRSIHFIEPSKDTRLLECRQPHLIWFHSDKESVMPFNIPCTVNLNVSQEAIHTLSDASTIAMTTTDLIKSTSTDLSTVWYVTVILDY